MSAGEDAGPFRQYVVKVHSRCDLACDHCYVYEHADQSWRGRPLMMEERTAARLVDRMVEHARAHALRQITVVLHGGEPLLYGIERTRALLAALRTAFSGETRLDLRIHTNGVRLNREFLDVFDAFDVKVGISLDGDRASNDLHRRFANGHTSHPQVLAALELLRGPTYRHLFAGILCTIDLRNDPVAVYQALAAEQPPRVDLLLPHATWDTPPLRGIRGVGAEGEYGYWLTSVYERWSAEGRPFPIRTFDSVAAVLRGEPSQTESLGLAPSDLVVIETDGSIEQVDSLKSAYDGAPATGFDIFEHSFDQAARHAGIVARQQGADSLCETCRACPLVEVCGGGLYTHRYRTGSDFDNPSVYCEDLKIMIEYVRGDRTARTMSAPGAHALPQDDFDALAAGFGGADTIKRLGETQQSITKALVIALCGMIDRTDPYVEAREEIYRLDTENSAALEGVLAHPYLRVWAADSLSQRPGGNTAGSGVDVSRLGAIAASAALRAGREAELPVQVTRGSVHLPTVGALVVGGEDRLARITTRADGTATIRVDDRAYLVSAFEDAKADDAWQPLRTLSTSRLDVVMEDLDPYRDCHHWPAAERLSAQRLAKWRELFAASIAFLDKELPHYLPGLAAGLTTLMPIKPPSYGYDLSATARQAYGTVGVAMPADGPALALMLIHEFQHVKLGAVLDMYDLVDHSDGRLFYAPWRDDPRPLEGLFQGTYAHIAVADFWRLRRNSLAGAQQEAAEANFARWRRQTAEAIEVLLGSGSLTELGTRFVGTMAETVTPWLDEPVGQAALDAAEQAASRHRAAWEAHLAKGGPAPAAR